MGTWQYTWHDVEAENGECLTLTNPSMVELSRAVSQHGAPDGICLVIDGQMFSYA